MIVTVGISHRDAPIEVRERLAIAKEALPDLLRRLVALSAVSEAACLSTCNRVEIYAAAAGTSEPEIAEAATQIAELLVGIGTENGARAQDVQPRRHVGTDAVRHLFRVASSLDSLVVGEPQILGQVKDAFEAARGAGTVGKLLDRAISRALHVAKRVRSETAIGEGQTSVSSVAVDLAHQIFGDLTGRTTLLVGAGEMAESAAKLFVKAGAKLLVANRSPERASALAHDLGGEPRPFADLAAALAAADVVVTSTAARTAVVTRPMVADAMRLRRGKSLFFIDIAVPRDVDPEVNRLDNVYVYDIDDLSHIVADAMKGRKAEADRAEQLVEREAARFESWTGTLNVSGTIAALRARTRSALGAEIEKSLAGKLRHLSEADRKALAVMTDAAVGRLLHTPITRLKALAGEPRADEFVEALHHLFELPEISESTLPGASTADDDAQHGDAQHGAHDPTEAAAGERAGARGTPDDAESTAAKSSSDAPPNELEKTGPVDQASARGPSKR